MRMVDLLRGNFGGEPARVAHMLPKVSVGSRCHTSFNKCTLRCSTAWTDLIIGWQRRQRLLRGEIGQNEEKKRRRRGRRSCPSRSFVAFQSRTDNAKAEAYLCSWRSGLSGSWTLKVKGNEP